MVLKLLLTLCIHPSLFENDVKMYGTQAAPDLKYLIVPFENDVKMYGTQAKYVAKYHN